MKLCMFSPRGRNLIRGWPGRIDGDRVVQLAAQTLQSYFSGGGKAREHAEYRLDEVDLLPPVLHPPAVRDFYAFERHVATMWGRRGSEVPEAWYRLPIFYFSNTSEIRGADDAVWAPRGSTELDYELEVAALVDTPATDMSAAGAEEAIGGYTIFNDWSARDLQSDETTVRLGPAKGKDFATSLGPELVSPDELPGDLDMRAVARVNGEVRTDSRTGGMQFSWDEILEHAARNTPGLQAGDVIVAVNGEELTRSADLADLVSLFEPGERVELGVLRDGDRRTIEVELGERPRRLAER